MQFTVSTVDSTETDHRIASRLVNVPYEQKRYQDLTPLISDNIINEKRKVKIAKKADPNYLARKQIGPSVQDLSLLHVHNPLVEMKFKVDGRGQRDSGGGGAGAGGAGGAGISESSNAKNEKSSNLMMRGNNYTGNKAEAVSNSGNIAGLESSIDPCTLLPTFSFDIKYVCIRIILLEYLCIIYDLYSLLSFCRCHYLSITTFSHLFFES